MVKNIVLGIAIVAALVVAYIYRGLVSGVVLGGLATVVYFTFTGSQLNWKPQKKK